MKSLIIVSIALAITYTFSRLALRKIRRRGIIRLYRIKCHIEVLRDDYGCTYADQIFYDVVNSCKILNIPLSKLGFQDEMQFRALAAESLRKCEARMRNVRISQFRKKRTLLERNGSGKDVEQELDTIATGSQKSEEFVLGLRRRIDNLIPHSVLE